MNIDEDSRLGAVLFYSYWTKRTNEGKSSWSLRTFADITYLCYDHMACVNKRM